MTIPYASETCSDGRSFSNMPLFLRFLLVSVDLDLSLTPDLTVNWVIAMKQNRTIMTLAAFFLIGGLVTASAVPAMEGTERGSGFHGHVSAPSLGNYENFLQDEDAAPAAPRSNGFGGYLEDESSGLMPPTPSMYGSSPLPTGTVGGCYGFGGDGQFTRVWGSVDYMMLWSKGRYLPPLVTTDPTLNDPPRFPGMVLFGGQDVGEDLRSAGRFALGAWIDRCEQVGVGGRFLISQTDEVSFARASNAAGLPVLARPFYNAQLGRLDALFSAAPGPGPGQVADRATNDLMNLDAYFRVLLYQYENRRLDLMVGYQFSEIRDRVSLWNRDVTAVRFDEFDAANTFHGVGLGLLGEYRYGGLTFSLLSKLGLGNMHRNVQINGYDTTPGWNKNVGEPFQGGIFALPPNRGIYQDDAFSIVPEVEVKMLYEISNGLEVSLGYSFVHWTNVALAGDQFDTVNFGGNVWARSNSNWIQGVPGTPFPTFNGINDGGFWAQGLTFGVTFKR